MLTDFILHYFMFCISRSFIFTSGFSEDLFSCLLLHFSKQLWFWSSRMHLNRTSMNVSVLINCFPGLFIFFFGHIFSVWMSTILSLIFHTIVLLPLECILLHDPLVWVCAAACWCEIGYNLMYFFFFYIVWFQ